jgi:methionyl-tRNA formyltransferase
MVHNKVRAITAYTMHNDIRVKILRTIWHNEQLSIETVQPEGKKPMAYPEFIKGYGPLQLF